MNFKRLRGIAAVAFTTIAAALLAGCMNSMAGSVDSSSRMATLQLSATGIPNDYAEQFAKSYPTAAKAASRSITPNDPYEIGKETGQSAGLTFKLSGKSETGKIQSEIEVTLVASGDIDVATGNAIYNFAGNVVLDAMSWNLKLVAYKGEDAVLQGFCSVDLRTGSGTAKFTMGTEGLDTKGSVTISGTFVDSGDAAASYSMGIYRKDTGAALLTPKTGTCSVSGGDESFTFAETGTVPPGTYLYTMIFYAGANCTGNIVGSFTDTLVVDPGNALERTLVIDVIGKNPEKPTDLKAYLVNGTEGKNGSPTYNVKVEWGKSRYATNYELQVLEYKGDDTDASFVPVYDTTTDEPDAATKGNWIVTTYGMRSMDSAPTKTIIDFAGSSVYGTEVGTSYIMFGDTSCSLVLETGKIYEIRLRGRNYIGVSKFAERVTSIDDTGLTGFAADTDKKDHINRLLVTYHLNGGILEKKVGEGAWNSYENVYSEYKSWKPSLNDTDTALVEDDSSAYKIYNGTSAFDSWLFEKGEGLQDTTKINDATTDASKQKVTNFTYKNLTVFASYGNKVTGNISMGAALEDIELGLFDVSFDDTTLNASTNGTDVVLNKYTIEKVPDNGTNNKLRIVLDTSNTKNYKDVSFTLIDAQNNRKTLPVDSGTDRTCTIDLVNYPVGGKIQVMVSAVTNKTTTVSQTLIFDLQ